MFSLNIPDSTQKRVVVIGGGFAGITLIKKLDSTNLFQIVLLDKNNFHQFQPLFYQVAMAGLEPSSISFPFRKMIQKFRNTYFRMAEVKEIQTKEQVISTNKGELHYDYLVIATGVDTNFFNNKELEENVIPMKSVAEALYLRNSILKDFENALLSKEEDLKEKFLDVAIVGGGPTGVEVAGSIAEMKKYILPKDYKELDTNKMDIYLIQGGNRLLDGMSAHASENAEKELLRLGVIVKKGHYVQTFDGDTITLNNGEQIKVKKVIWAAGIVGKKIKGLEDSLYTRGNRLQTNEYSQLNTIPTIYAVGDIAATITEKLPYGHPQVAQVAIQQAKNLAKNLIASEHRQPLKPFIYKDLGSMATIGRNAAVVDFPKWKLKGFLAWWIWLLVHLFSILGIKNKVVILINWTWNYFTYDQSLRLLIRPFHKLKTSDSSSV